MYKYLSSLLLACCFLCLSLAPVYLNAQAPGSCGTPPLGRVNGTDSRRRVEGDYVVIEYNAQSLQTFWYDYHGGFGDATNINRNGSFLPVVYTKEKIAVHVCGLQFGDLLTVTTSPVGTPEGGADIRGTTPTAIPSLTNTLDALQSGAATGGTTPASGLGFGPTTALGSTVVSGVTQGTMTYDGGKATYTDANITASGEQVAIMMYALQTNALALIHGVRNNIAGWVRGDHPIDPLEPGSVGYLLKASDDLRSTIRGHIGDIQNAAAFDRDVTAVQSFSAELSTLANALSTQGFGARAVTIQSNYATLRGILEFVRQGLSCSPSDVYDPAKAGSAPKISPKVTKAKQAATAKKAGAQDTPPPPHIDEVYPCHKFEDQKFEAFDNAYEDEIGRLTGKDPREYESDVERTQVEMFEVLRELGENLAGIDRNVSAIFNDMNDWNKRSSVEQTDLIAPATSNALMRVSIIVQRGYTPFVLANTPSSAPAAAAAPSAAAAPAAASTSTPPHAVKTILVEVHRVANFNLAGGVMLIHVPTSTYTVVPSPTPGTASTTSPTQWSGTCNGTTVSVPAPNPVSSGTPPPPTYSCIAVTQRSQWQIAGMAGLTWYPWGRDYFPRHSGFASYRRNLMPSLLLATSVTSLGNAVGAVNWEPIGGIDLFAGIGSAHRNVLPSGLTTTTAVPTGYSLQTATQMHVGFATGVAFDLGVFMQLFQNKTAAAGMP